MPIKMIYVIGYCKRFFCVRYILRGPREPSRRKNINANMNMYPSFGNVTTRAYKKNCFAYKLILSKLRNEVIAKERVFTVTLNYNSVA